MVASLRAPIAEPSDHSDGAVSDIFGHSGCGMQASYATLTLTPDRCNDLSRYLYLIPARHSYGQLSCSCEMIIRT